MLITLALLAAIILAAGFLVGIYNRLIKNRNLVQEGFSGIEVQLKKRADLIPNLIETVKGYMKHEREVLEDVTKYRAMAGEASGAAQTAQAEGMLSQALGRLFAVAESYPDLKANQNFMELQSALQEVEQSIEMARRYYNGVVRNYNITVESFPSNLVANSFGFAKEEYFEIQDQADRQVPEVRF